MAANSNLSFSIDRATSTTSNDSGDEEHPKLDPNNEKNDERIHLEDLQQSEKLSSEHAGQEISMSHASTQTAEPNIVVTPISSAEDIHLKQIASTPSIHKTLAKEKQGDSNGSDQLSKQGSSEKLRTRTFSASSQRSDNHLHRLLSNISTFSDGPFCRICHEGDSKEDLISPCKCSGTMGLMHRTCIETWLGSSNSNKCEICNYVYTTRRYTRPFCDWLRYPTSSQDRKNLIADTVCFVLLTPLAVVSAWLCITGALHYSSIQGGNWEAIGLIGLTCFLLLIYLVWCSVAIRYHVRIWVDWRNSNQRVTVVDLNAAQSGTNDDENNNNTQLQNVSLSPISSATSVATADESICMPGNNNCRTCSSRRRFNDQDFHLVPVVILNQEYSIRHDPACSLNTSLAIPAVFARVTSEREIISGRRCTIAQWRDSELVTVPSSSLMSNSGESASVPAATSELSPTMSCLSQHTEINASTPAKQYHYYQPIPVSFSTGTSPIRSTQKSLVEDVSFVTSNHTFGEPSPGRPSSDSSDMMALLPENKDSNTRRTVRETVV